MIENASNEHNFIEIKGKRHILENYYGFNQKNGIKSGNIQ